MPTFQTNDSFEEEKVENKLRKNEMKKNLTNLWIFDYFIISKCVICGAALKENIENDLLLLIWKEIFVYFFIKMKSVKSKMK